MSGWIVHAPASPRCSRRAPSCRRAAGSSSRRTSRSSRARTASRPTSSTAATSSNGGEAVTLVDVALAVVDTVTYADVDPWPATARRHRPVARAARPRGRQHRWPRTGARVARSPAARHAPSTRSTAPARRPGRTGARRPPRCARTRTRPSSCRPGCPSARPPSLTYKVMFAADVVDPVARRRREPRRRGRRRVRGNDPRPGCRDGSIRYRVDAVSDGVPFALPAVGDTHPLPRRGGRSTRRSTANLPDDRVVHGGRRLQRHPRQPPLRRLPGRGRRRVQRRGLRRRADERPWQLHRGRRPR